MKNLIKKILRESDDWDWVRDIVSDERITKDNVEVGMRVRMNPDSEFVRQTKTNGHGTVSHINDDDFPEIDGDVEKYWVYVNWDDGGRNSYRVGDVKFDLLFPNEKPPIKESDELDWIRTTDINPWVEYDGIHFDIEPSEGDVFKYIEMALNSFDVLNSDDWESPHKDDIDSIIEYFRNKKIVYLIMDNKGELSYGTTLIYYDNGSEFNLIKYSQLNDGDTITESDELDWIRTTEINPWVEYDCIVFDIEPSREDVNTYIEMALNTLNLSNADHWLYDREIDISTILHYFHNDGFSYLFTDRNYIGEESGLYYDGDKAVIPKGSIQIKYSQLKGGNTITESDEFDWIRDVIDQPINPWEEYEAIIFDVVPTREDVNTYIVMALNTRDISNATHWEDRTYDIPAIIGYVERGSNAYLSITKDFHGTGGSELLYGYDLQRNQKSIKYSELKALNLNESDELDWIRTTEPTRIQKNESYIMTTYDLQQFLTTVERELPLARWASGDKPTRFTPLTSNPTRNNSKEHYIKIIINYYNNLSYSFSGPEDFNNSINWP